MNGQAKKINLSPDQSEIIIITQDCNLKIFAINKNEDQVFIIIKLAIYFLKEIPVIHREGLNDARLTSDNQFFITVGDDSLIKVWDREYKIKNP